MATVDDFYDDADDGQQAPPEWQGPMPDAAQGPPDVFGGQRDSGQSDYLLQMMSSLAEDPNRAVPSYGGDDPLSAQDQQGVANSQMMAQMTDRLARGSGPPAPVKVPWWVKAIGGATDLAGILSYKHQTRPRNVVVGRNEFGGDIHRRVRGSAPLPEFGGINAFTMGPAANARNDARYQHEVGLNRRAAIPGLVRSMGQQFAPPQLPKPPEPSAWLRTYRDIGSVAGPEAQMLYVRKTTSGAYKNKMEQAESEKAFLDNYEHANGKDARKDLERIMGVRAETVAKKPIDEADTLRLLKAKKKAGIEAAEEQYRAMGLMTPALKSKMSSMRAAMGIHVRPEEARLKTLQAVHKQAVEAEQKAVIAQIPGTDPATVAAMMAPLQQAVETADRAVKRQADKVYWLGQQVEDKIKIALKLPLTGEMQDAPTGGMDGDSDGPGPDEAAEVGGGLEGDLDASGFNPYDTEGADASVDPAASDIQFAMDDPAIRALPMGDGLVGDYLDRLDKMTPAEQQEVGLMIRQAMGADGQ